MIEPKEMTYDEFPESMECPEGTIQLKTDKN